MDNLVLWHAHDLALEVTEHSSVFNVSTVVIGHFVVDVDTLWDVNVVLWEDIDQSLNDSGIDVASAIDLDDINCHVCEGWESRIENGLPAVEERIFEAVGKRTSSFQEPVVGLHVKTHQVVLEFEV